MNVFELPECTAFTMLRKDARTMGMMNHLQGALIFCKVFDEAAVMERVTTGTAASKYVRWAGVSLHSLHAEMAKTSRNAAVVL